ncbi:glycoside hydrolase family 108 protein [Rhizobium sp. P32RR-XVIII]|uniref:glycoside hydrolase family 108 protein n=1 Tax=Rhizobium sp. P32RR-XVIII TaxID=2726738 RepID=UPI001FEF3101|nr:glycosyl hydrolase 108 family protein [Rhizobium sp. P32RR-XVIII]
MQRPTGAWTSSRDPANEFARSLAKVLIIQGGYSNNPKDPGGATMKGVTQGVYDEYRRTHGLPLMPVKNISNSELEAIHRKKYWDEIKGDKLAPGVSYVVFDGSVNSGVAQSVKWLQRALQAMGLYQGLIDGILGQGTLLALGGVNDNDSLIARILDRRLALLKALKTWKRSAGAGRPASTACALSGRPGQPAPLALRSSCSRPRIN